MINNFFKIILFLFIINCKFIHKLFALEPIFVFENWSLFTTKLENGNTLCYIMTLPIEKRGDYKKRAEPYFIVMREKNSNYDEIVLSSGVIFKDDEDAEISILKRKFPLFVDNEQAFTYDRNDDFEMIKIMKLASKMYVSGISKRNFKIDDIYSLIGFNEVYQKMLTTCE